MIITILVILLYALVACLVLELQFYVIGLFLTVPGRARQLVYAIVGVLFLIWIVQIVMAGGGPVFHLPGLDRR